MHKLSVVAWEIIGIIFIILVGSLLHFVFEWSNGLALVGIFSAVNESVWEHLKLGFWSLVLFSLVEYWFINTRTNNFLLAKGLGILVLQSCILIVFYTYTMFSAKPILFIDISSYVLGSILCQVVSYKILTKTGERKTLNILGLGIILIHGILLITFTFTPPKHPVFQDSHTFLYGIPPKAP